MAFFCRFLSVPTLVIGCVGVTFGLYGFWGAQKCDPNKIRAHFIWLLLSVVLLIAVSWARIYTSRDFCENHNCVVDHMYYTNQAGLSTSQFANLRADARSAAGSSVASVPQTTLEEEAVVREGTEGRTLPKQESAPRMLLVPPLPHKAPPPVMKMPPLPDSHANHQQQGGHRSLLAKAASVESGNSGFAIPIYREPCYVDHMKPSAAVCVEAHKLLTPFQLHFNAISTPF